MILSFGSKNLPQYPVLCKPTLTRSLTHQRPPPTIHCSPQPTTSDGNRQQQWRIESAKLTPNPNPNVWRLFVDQGGHQQPDFLIGDRFLIFHSTLQGAIWRVENRKKPADRFFKRQNICKKCARFPWWFFASDRPRKKTRPCRRADDRIVRVGDQQSSKRRFTQNGNYRFWKYMGLKNTAKTCKLLRIKSTGISVAFLRMPRFLPFESSLRDSNPAFLTSRGSQVRVLYRPLLLSNK